MVVPVVSWSAMAQRRGDFSADSELSRICTELWKLDDNRLKPGEDYQINLQGGRSRYYVNWLKQHHLTKVCFV